MKKILMSKVTEAKKILRAAYKDYPAQQTAIAWTGGKDSTVILDLAMDEFGGKIPFLILFNDSTLEFDEIYDFIKQYSSLWNLDLIWLKHLDSDLLSYENSTNPEDKMEIMRIAKINALNYAVTNYNLTCLISGIRKDEHDASSDESPFSPRISHMRVHPILEFTLDDIWEYIHERKVPYVDLYDKGYKSLGEKPFTHPVSDPNAPERAGREATKEKTMKRLRDLGYW